MRPWSKILSQWTEWIDPGSISIFWSSQARTECQSGQWKSPQTNLESREVSLRIPRVFWGVAGSTKRHRGDGPNRKVVSPGSQCGSLWVTAHRKTQQWICRSPFSSRRAWLGCMISYFRGSPFHGRNNPPCGSPWRHARRAHRSKRGQCRSIVSYDQGKVWQSSKGSRSRSIDSWRRPQISIQSRPCRFHRQVDVSPRIALNVWPVPACWKRSRGRTHICRVCGSDILEERVKSTSSQLYVSQILWTPQSWSLSIPQIHESPFLWVRDAHCFARIPRVPFSLFPLSVFFQTQPPCDWSLHRPL